MAPARVTAIVVSYDSKEFLCLCLDSLLRSQFVGELEVIVIDNSSSDGTVEAVQQYYPDVILVANNENIGFSRACNQGANMASGDYLLFLNPDTIVPEDAVQLCLDAFHRTEMIGAVGVDLIDGSGKYLPESARRLPGITNVTVKLLGLSKFLGPLLAKMAYYAPPDDTEVEVLPGAFILVSKSVFHSLAGFDEQFFMYGEDIDFSYRLHEKGYKNIRIKECRVIHFKGESTDKDSDAFTENFYGAFKRYATKHQLVTSGFSKALMGLTLALIQWKKRSERIVYNWLRAALHFAVFVILFYAAHALWETVFFRDLNHFPKPELYNNVLLYAFLFTLAYYVCGVYLKDQKVHNRYNLANLYGAIITVVIYAFLPADMRFSRMSVILGILLIFLIFSLFSFLQRQRRHSSLKGQQAVLVTKSSDEEDISRIENLTGATVSIVKSIDEFKHDTIQVSPKVLLLDVGKIKFKEAVRLIKLFGRKKEVFFISSDRSFALSSRSSSLRGTIVRSQRRYAIDMPVYQHQKRIFDVVFGFYLLLICPVVTLISLSTAYVVNVWTVLIGQRTLVSYNSKGVWPQELPETKKGFLSPASDSINDKSERDEILRDYAINYRVLKDVFTCIGNFGILIKNLAWR